MCNDDDDVRDTMMLEVSSDKEAADLSPLDV